jgi:serine/threonine-protein kinase
LAQKVDTDKLIGQVLDKKYKVEALVARGGMAKVYKALQTNLNRHVAIKVLDPKHVDANDPQFRERFELEAQMTSQLNHPNTVTIHDYGYSEQFDCFYFVMEFIKGKTLRREMKEVGCFPVERALYIAQQIARSVRQAHSVGVIHRDLKPSNVLLTSHDDDRDWVKVVDFGLLKLRKESVAESSKGVLMGSPRYMSPEQIRRDEMDHRSDAYSLGVNLYQMLAGRPPFLGEKAMDILMGHLNDPPEMISTYTDRDDVPAEVESFAMQMLAKSPDDRPNDLEEVIEALGRLRKMVRRKDSIAPSPPGTKVGEGSQPKEVATDLSADIEEIPAQSSVQASWSDTVPQQDLVGPITGQSSSPVMTPVPEQTQPPGRKIGWIVMASLIILALGGGAILMIFMMDPEKNSKASKQPPVPERIVDPPPPDENPTEPPPEEATGPQPMQTFNVTFTTDPDGAVVFEGDAKLCTTPCETEWIVVDGAGDARKFVLIKEGYEKLEIVENAPTKDIDVTVDLFPLTEDSGKKPGVKIPGKTTKAPGKKPPSEDETPPPGKKKKSLGLDEEFPE